MVFTQHFCAACGSEHIRRNGSVAGHAKYHCRSCGYQARFIPAAAAKAVQYEQVDKLLSERVSQRSIVRLTGISRMTVAKRAKQPPDSTAAFAASAAEEGPEETLGSA